MESEGDDEGDEDIAEAYKKNYVRGTRHKNSININLQFHVLLVAFVLALIGGPRVNIKGYFTLSLVARLLLSGDR